MPTTRWPVVGWGGMFGPARVPDGQAGLGYCFTPRIIQDASRTSERRRRPVAGRPSDIMPNAYTAARSPRVVTSPRVSPVTPVNRPPGALSAPSGPALDARVNAFESRRHGHNGRALLWMRFRLWRRMCVRVDFILCIYLILGSGHTTVPKILYARLGICPTTLRITDTFDIRRKYYCSFTRRFTG